MASKNYSGKNTVLYLLTKIKEKMTALETSLNGSIATKVDKVEGKGLSTNDFTNELKAKLESDESFSGKYEDLTGAPTDISAFTNDQGYQTSTEVSSAIATATTDMATNASVQSAINAAKTGLASENFVKTQIAELVNGAPEALDTLKELADAFEGADDTIGTLTSEIGKKVNETDLEEIKNEEVDAIWNKVFTS